MKLKKRLVAYGFVLPAILLYVVFILVPTLSGMYYSMTDWGGLSSDINFIGLENYKRLIEDSVFFVAIRNTLVLTVVTVLLQNVFGLLLAVALNSHSVKFRNGFRTVFFIPSLLSIIVIGYTWINLLNVYVGPFADFLNFLNVESVAQYDILQKPFWSIITISLVMVWQYSGYNMFIYISGLQSIPHSIYEAAEIDGASNFKKFTRITLPLIMPSITVNMTINVVGCLKVFEHVYVMTGGGPGNSTETIGTYIYNSAFGTNQLGYGTALSTVLFIGIMIITTLQLKFLRSREVEM